MRELACAALGFVAGTACGTILAFRRAAAERRRYGKLLAFVLHELNTPLTSLHMTVLNFLQGVFGPLPKEHETWMNVLKEQTTRLGYLLGDTRDLIHMQFQKDLKIHPEPASLGNILVDVLSQMESSLARGGVEISREIASNLPDVAADKDELHRILFSVLANARKFQSGGKVFVSLQEMPPEPRAELRKLEVVVGYQGPKLSPSEATETLDLFYPVARRQGSDVLPCVGLGLGFCRRLLELQGGELRLEVEAGGVSRIRLRLPVATAV